MRSFDVVTWPEGKWWVIEVPELDTAGQAASFAGVDDAARDICAVWLDVDASEVEVVVQVRVPEDAQNEWDSARELEDQARRLQEEAARRRRAAIAELTQGAYTFRAVGKAFGISPQRVAQLLPGNRSEKSRHVRGVSAPTGRFVSTAAGGGSGSREASEGSATGKR